MNKKTNKLVFLQVLVDCQADLNQTDVCDWTALAHATENNHKDIVELLLGSGANMNYQNRDYEIPILQAARQGNTEIIDVFLQAGVSVDAEILPEEKTSLMFAAEEGDIGTLQFLLKKGADIELQSLFDKRALDFAASGGHVDIVRILLQAGAKTESRNTPLRSVFEGRRANTQIIKMLLAAGSDVRNLDGTFYSVLDYAILRSSGNDHEQIGLIYAAGASMCTQIRNNLDDHRNVIPQFIIEQEDPQSVLDLMSMCRKQIREQLLSPTRSNQKYLNTRLVDQLPLPKLVKEILLFGFHI